MRYIHNNYLITLEIAIGTRSRLFDIFSSEVPPIERSIFAYDFIKHKSRQFILKWCKALLRFDQFIPHELVL